MTERTITKRRIETIQLKLRLTPTLRRRIVAAAAKRGVSMNTEMVDRLAASFERKTG